MHFCTICEIIFLVGGPWKSNVVLEKSLKNGCNFLYEPCMFVIRKYSVQWNLPNDPPINTTTSLLWPYSLDPNLKITESFHDFEHPINMTTSLFWPGLFGPMVVTLMGFHCSLLLNNVYCLFLSGEGKLISKDGTVYEGSFHNHRRHGEGKLMFRLGAVIPQAHNRPYSWFRLSLYVLNDLWDKSNVMWFLFWLQWGP